jgi:hypothetical protein
VSGPQPGTGCLPTQGPGLRGSSAIWTSWLHEDPQMRSCTCASTLAASHECVCLVSTHCSGALSQKCLPYAAQRAAQG